MSTTLITVAEAARRLGLSASQVRRYCAAGRLRARKVTERLYLVDAGSVARFRPDPPGPKPQKQLSRRAKTTAKLA